MGKVKRKKNKVQRSNPIGASTTAVGNSVEEEVLNNDALSQDPSSFIDTVVEQLKSHSVEERDSGLNTLSSACSDPGLLNQILKHDIAKTVYSLLEDKSPIVRHSAAGALRNMSTIGSAVCSNMISQGIMEHLVKLFKNHYSKDWKPQSNSQSQSHSKSPSATNAFKIDSMMETYIEAVNLLWNLCESSGQALKVFNEEELAEILIRSLDVKEYGMRVAIASGQCLNTVTEDNREAIPNIEQLEGSLEKILNSDYDSKTLNDDDENDWLYLQTLASGILLNLAQQISNLQPTTITLILRTVTKILQVDQNREVSIFSSEIPLRDVNGHSRPDEMETDSVQTISSTTNGDKLGLTVEKVHSLEISKSKISNLLNGQMLALEILTNALYVEGDEDGSDFDESDEDDVERMEEDAEFTPNDNFTSCVGIIPEVHAAVVKEGLVQTVFDKFIGGPPTNVILILTESQEYGKSILSSIEHLKCRAMLCYQNLIIGLDPTELGGHEVMKITWNHFVGHLRFEADNNNADGELSEACTAGMRALAQKWLDCNEIPKMESLGDFGSLSSLEELNVLAGIYSKATVAKIHTNIIKIIGNLGALLVNKNEKFSVEETEARLEFIGAFLLSRISTYGDGLYLWRVSEALDGLFDVFAEDNFNHILNKLGAMEKLKAYLPIFKKNIRNERKRLGENRVIIETSKDNLTRFIDYKIKNGCT